MPIDDIREGDGWREGEERHEASNDECRLVIHKALFLLPPIPFLYEEGGGHIIR